MNRRKVYELRIKDIWNLGSLNISEDNFDIKIISQNQIYYIPFKQTEI